MDLQELLHIEKLVNHKNFNIWKFQISIAFKSKGIYEVVSGQEVLDEVKHEQDKSLWIKKDAKAQHMIVSTVDKKCMMHILNCKTSCEMFKKLCMIFDRDTDQQKYSALQEFFTYRYAEESNISTHISNLENLVFRLNNLEKQIDDDMLITKILTTLPEKYNYFISAWESTQKSEKTLENLTSRLLNEEKRLKGHENETEKPVSFRTSPFNKWKYDKYKEMNKNFKNKDSNFNSKSKQKCGICKKSNHTEDNCFFRKSCSICKKRNHTEENCFFRNKNKNQVTFLSNNNKISDQQFIVDSGASCHMINTDCLKNEKEICTDISVAKQGQEMKAIKTGTYETKSCKLKNVLYVPDLSKNLLSVNAITENAGIVKFSKNKVEVFKDGDLIIEGKKNNTGLYTVNLNKTEVLMTEQNNAVILHRKMGHLCDEYLKTLKTLANGITLCDEDLKNLSKNCDICYKSKKTRIKFGHDRTRATRPLGIIHSDVVGPLEVSTWDNSKYFVTFLDDYTHFARIYLLKHKSEVSTVLKQYILEAENYWNLKAAKIRCDNGGEYVSTDLINWCKSRGTVLDYTIPYTPELNGKAERLNRTLMGKTRALLFDSNLEKEMWGEALYVATYLHNRSPTTAIDTLPAEKWFGKKQNLSNLQIFGSTAYAKNLGHLKKLQSRCEKYIFIGYAPNGYRLWDPEKRKIKISRDVYFIDTKESEHKQSYSNFQFLDLYPNDTDDISENYADEDKNFKANKDIQKLDMEQNKLHEEVESKNSNENKEKENGEELNEEELGRGKRMKRPPEKLGEYVLLTYKEAMNSPEKLKWQQAINEEKKSLEENKTWNLIDEKEVEGKKILTNKWVFKIKDDGKYKARLVVRGFEQEQGIDFEETYSPVVGSDSLRVIFATAMKKNFNMKKFDVKTAFLYGNLQEETYMYLPEGYEGEKKICKLEKALYGLKQAPYAWNKTLTNFLKLEGLESLKTEQCIFVNMDKTLILAIYVDDGILLGDSKAKMNDLLTKLKTRFEMTSLDEPESFLGIDLTRNSFSLKISQAKYASQVLQKFRMTEAKPSNTPILSNKRGNSTKKINYPYREVIGSLLYLSTKTRPDLSYAVGFCSRYVENPTQEDLENLKRILKYLKGTVELGITYNQNSDINLIAYCDADYAGDVETRKSTTGYVIYYCGGPISWVSRKQPIVATSSTEAEYISAAECCKELVYLKTLIEELTGEKISATMNIDNQSAIELIRKGVLNQRSKHIDVRFHFIKEKYEQKIVDIKYCPTQHQIADILTKPLGEIKFAVLRNELVY